jgi:proton-coupled amino acid transporter
LAFIAVLTMDNLDKVVSLMGSLIGCPLAFIFPPLIHSKLDSSLSASRRLGNRFVVIMGFFAMLLASTTTLLAW